MVTKFACNTRPVVMIKLNLALFVTSPFVQPAKRELPQGVAVSWMVLPGSRKLVPRKF